MKCLPYGYEKGSTSGNENILISFLPSALSLSLVLFLSYRSGSADALELGGGGFFFRVAVYVRLCF